jgi:S-layer protein
MALTQNQQIVHQMYIAYYQRPADPEGLAYWVDQIETAGGWPNVAAAFGAPENAEYTALYGGKTRAEIVADLYQSAFGRAAVQSEIDFWADSDFADTSLGFAIISGAQNDDLATVTNKVAFAEEIVALTVTNAGYAQIADVKAVLTAIDANSDVSASAVKSAIEANTVGDTFTLTAGTDNIFGTANNDTIVATDLTYNAANDVVADSTTTDSDTLNFAVTTDDTDLNLTGAIIGIENVNVNVNQFSNASFALDLNGVSGANTSVDVTQVGSSVNTIAISNVATGTISLSSDFTTSSVATDADADIVVNTAGVTNAITQTGTANTLEIVGTGATSTTLAAAAATDSVKLTTTGEAIVTATAGLSGTAGVLTVDSQKGALVTATSAKTVNITAVEDADIVAAANATDITVSAAGTNNDIVASSSTLSAGAATTVNLSGNGAAVEYDLQSSNLVSTINISGDQNVEVVVDGANIDALANDKLTVVDTSTAGESRLSLQAAGTVDLSAAAVDVIALEADQVGDTTTVATGANVQVAVDQGAAATITAAVSTAATNTLNLNINDNATAVNVLALTTNVLSNFKTINVALTDSLTVTTSLNAGTADVVVTGAGALTLDGVTAASVDASDVTGVVTADLDGLATVGTLKTGNKADVIDVTAALTTGSYAISTGAGNDTINMTDADVVINGGDGNDTVAFAATTDLTGQAFDLTSIELVTIAAGATVTVDSEEITGETFIVNGANATSSVLDVTVIESTVDLSNLSLNDALLANTVIDGTAFTGVLSATVTGTNGGDTITVDGGKASTANGGAGNDTITGGAAADTLNGDAGDDTLNGAGGNDILNGGAGVDTLNGGIGNDSITGGEGADLVFGGAGADTISLTETTAAADVVGYQALTEGSAAGVAAGTFTGFDVVTGFGTGDTVKFDDDLSDNNIANAFVDNKYVVASDAAVTASNDLTTAADFTNVDKVVAFLNDAAGYSGTASEKDVVGITFGGNTNLYGVSNDGTQAVVATEVTLIGTYDAELAVADITIA